MNALLPVFEGLGVAMTLLGFGAAAVGFAWLGAALLRGRDSRQPLGVALLGSVAGFIGVMLMYGLGKVIVELIKLFAPM